MQHLIEFFQSDSVLALAVSATIFLITVILVAKRFIGFMITLLLLAFSIAAGYAILNHNMVHEYLQERWDQPTTFREKTEERISPETLKEQMMQAFKEIKKQLKQEKESLNTVMEDLQDLFQDVGEQRERLQSLIQQKRASSFEGDSLQKEQSND